MLRCQRYLAVSRAWSSISTLPASVTLTKTIAISRGPASLADVDSGDDKKNESPTNGLCMAKLTRSTWPVWSTDEPDEGIDAICREVWKNICKIKTACPVECDENEGVWEASMVKMITLS